MDIKQVIRVVNQMRADGIIEDYAIGGAVGATFYLEPLSTLDVDVFVAFKPDPNGPIISPKPILDYLQSKGCKLQAEHVIIAGWPVQFLPPINALVEEAMMGSTEKDVDGMPARVFTAEHLAAIALQTGRAKDKARLLQFVEAGALNSTRFQAILTRHNLLDAWQRFESQFLRDNP